MIERLILKCKEACTSVIAKNEDLFDLAHKSEDPEVVFNNLEQWLETISKRYDKIIAAAAARGPMVLSKKKRERSSIHLTFQNQDPV